VNLLITLYYNAESGGLHDNVFATAVEAKRKGYNVFVACRSGSFNDRLKDNRIFTITIDQDKKIDSINKIQEVMGDDIDLIHAHPGNSRIIAMRLHKKLSIPVIFHVHGAWLDGVEYFIEDVECVFAVSESTKQKIVKQCGGYEHKVHVIPNYSDYSYNIIKDFRHESEQKQISLITRLDLDKKLILDEFQKIIPKINNSSTKIKINIIGDGTLREEFMNKLYFNIDNELIELSYIGWVKDKTTLKEYIEKSDIVIGPGRVAIDSLTLGVPVLVVGSQNYQGIITKNNWQSFVSSNFGGYGKNECLSKIEDDIEILLYNQYIYETSMKIGRKLIEIFFDKTKTIEKHFDIYSIVTKQNDVKSFGGTRQ